MYRILKLLSPFNNLHVNVSILLSHLYYFFCATIYFVLKAVSENSFIDSFKLNTLLCSILRISVQEIWVLNIFKIIPIYHASDDEDTIKSWFYSTCVFKSASKHRCSRYTSIWKNINMFTSFLDISFVLHMHCFRFYTFSMTAFVQFCFSYTYYLMCWKYLQGGFIQIIDSVYNNANHCALIITTTHQEQQQHWIMSCNHFNYTYKRLKWNFETCDYLSAYMSYWDTL